MPLIKQAHGRIDKEDYFLTGSLTDFLGGGVCSRKDGLFELEKGEIKRRFEYEEFSAVLRLESASGTTGTRMFFVETNQGKRGIQENAEERTDGYWRITCTDRFIQLFSSADGEAWMNEGGYPLEEQEKVLFLGFQVEGTATLCFSSCTAYRSPFLTVRNFPEDFMVKLFDGDGTLLKTEPFGPNMTARIELGKPMSGNISIFNLAEAQVCTGELTDFEPGDDWLWSDYQLELRYHDQVLDYGPTTLSQHSVHQLGIKNVGEFAVYDLCLALSGKDAKSVKVSLDGSDYTEQLTFAELNPMEEKSFYVKVDRQHDQFIVLDFQIEVW